MSNNHSIIIVGDLFPVPSNCARFSEGDIQYLFGSTICDMFARADYRICNLEGALTDNPGFREKTGPVLYAPTSVINGYRSLGIDCCTLANNHITDAGDQGVIDTIDVLDRAGIKHIGAGINSNSISRHVSFKVGNQKIGLFNVAETMYNEPSPDTPGAYLYDEYAVCREVESIKSECDFLIVVYHGGAEKFRYPSPQIRRRFHRMADCGADVVLSQHTHCIGSEEYYNGSYLLYGQGNFLFRSFNNEFTDTGLIVELILSDNGFTVKKHLVNAVGDTVRYDENQDLSEFNKRSEKVHDEAFVQDKFREYCLSEAFRYLRAYKGKVPFGRVVNHFFPKQYKRYIEKSYRREQLLFTLHSLRSEQNREVAIEGIKELLKINKYEG